MAPPRTTDQSKGAAMKTRSGNETPGKVLSGAGSPAVTVDKADKADKDKVKQLKLVQEPDGAVSTASPQPQPSQGDSTIKSLLERMEERLEKRFTKLEQSISGNFDKLNQEVKTLREEMTDSKAKYAELETKVTEVVKAVEFNSKTCEDSNQAQTDALDKAKEDLESKIKTLESKLLLQEKQDRKYNLLFYGIPEESGEDIEDKLKNLFVDVLNIEYSRVSNMYFAHGHRLPSNNPGPKPIILRFTNYGDRDLVLSNAYKLGGSKRRIIADWPVQMKNERGRLAKVAYKIRKEEKLQTRIKDKGLEVYLEVRKDEKDSWAKRNA